MKTFCLDSHKDWNDGVHMIVFAVREDFQESLGFISFQLVCGHSVGGPLTILKEKWHCENTVISILDSVECFKHKLTRACEIEQDILKQSQDKMKQWYDKDAIIIEFKSGENVIVVIAHSFSSITS